MRKICLTIIGMYVMMLHAFAQAPKDTSAYKRRRLKIEEINVVSSYYSQDGNHSPVTGGIGTEEVTDVSNTIEVKWVKWDAKQRKRSLTASIGIDHHTSASSAWVSETGASKTDGTRIYPSINWNVENDQKGRGFGLGVYYSSEYNYKSLGLDFGFTKKTSNNGEFSAKVTTYFDDVIMIYPSELEPPTSANTSASRLPSSARNTYTGSLGFSQVINQRLQASVMVEGVYQSGYLGLPFHRVYFNDGSPHIESLPSQRQKLPVAMRLNYFLGDNIVLRSYYRFYTDSWGLNAHTASLEVPVKITPFVSVSPFYRYYVQTETKYFAPYQEHTEEDTYYTSNYSLSEFSSHFFGAGFRLSPPDGIFNTYLNALEIRYGHYTQTTGLVSNVISMNLKFK
jgi:hypothetical protein